MLDGDTALDCDGLIVAVGAPQAARMLQSLDHALAADLGRIPYAGTSIVTLAYRREDIGHALDGFGFVVPAVENRRILAGSFSSVKFSGRAPADRVLVRVFVGGGLPKRAGRVGRPAARAPRRRRVAFAPRHPRRAVVL